MKKLVCICLSLLVILCGCSSEPKEVTEFREKLCANAWGVSGFGVTVISLEFNDDGTGELKENVNNETYSFKYTLSDVNEDATEGVIKVEQDNSQASENTDSESIINGSPELKAKIDGNNLELDNNGDQLKLTNLDEDTSDTSSTTTKSDDVSAEDFDDANTPEYTVGSTFNYNGVDITLDKATIMTEGEYTQPKEGYEYVQLTFTVANNSDANYDPSLIYLEGYVDKQKAESAYGAGNESLNDDLLAGTSGQDQFAFEVPTNWQKLIFTLNPNSTDFNTEKAKFIVRPDQCS